MTTLNHSTKLSARLAGIALCGILCGSPGADSFAQSYPVRPIRFIVAFPAGGGADMLARLIAPGLSENLGQQVVVDNRSGAGGNIGMELSARAAPDGYTLLMGSVPIAVNHILYRKASSDPLRDFSAVTLLSKTPNILAVHPSLPVRSVKDLIALARARPGSINYASGGSGTTLHLAAELLKTAAKIDVVHVPYKGAAQATIAVLAGESQMMLMPALTVLPHIKTAKLRALAITSLERIAVVSELPTVAESGLPGFEASQWYGVLAPAGTPDEIVTRLNRGFVKIVQTPEVRTRLVNDASTPVGNTPQEFASYLKSEIEKWSKVVRLSGAQAD